MAPTTSWTVPNAVLANTLKGGVSLEAKTYKMALLTSASNISATTTTYAGLTGEVANGGGYTTGGQTINFTVTNTVPARATVANSVSWTATGSITARHAVIYESGGNVLCYTTFRNEQDTADADLTATGGTFVVNFSSNGVLGQNKGG